MHENRFNEYRIPSGMLIVFLEKALTLIHMETNLDDVSALDTPFKHLCSKDAYFCKTRTSVSHNFRMKKSKNAANLIPYSHPIHAMSQ